MQCLSTREWHSNHTEWVNNVPRMVRYSLFGPYDVRHNVEMTEGYCHDNFMLLLVNNLYYLTNMVVSKISRK